MQLYGAVKHLDPIILTGLPRGNWAADQKMRWTAKHFPGVRMITCMARDKRNHAREGDVLVDDMEKYRHLWSRQEASSSITAPPPIRSRSCAIISI
jgi:hypothetical protein